MENKKPKIRVGGFNNHWNEFELGEISDIKTGPFGSTLHAKDYIEGGVPIITTEHFRSGQLPENKSNTPQVSDEDYLRLKSYKLQKGDIVFSRVGSIDINALVTDLQDGWLFSGRVLRVRPSKQFNSGYLHYLLETTPVRNDVVARAVGQTMPSINTEILKKTKIITSNNGEEQNEIFSILKNIDNIVSLHQQELDTLKQTKQGFLKKMFPKEGEPLPEIRFQGFTENWKEIKAASIFHSVSDKNHIDLPVLSASQKEGMVFRDQIGIDIQYNADSIKTYKRVTPGQFVIHLRSFQGGFALSNIEGITSPAYTVLDFKDKEMNSFLFWKNVLSSKTFIKRLETVTYGIRDGKSISFSDFSTLKFKVPTYEEQIQIGNFFKQFDELIVLQEKELDALKQTKKAFLQKMFV